MGTANSAAIRTFVVAGPYALNENAAVSLCDDGMPSNNEIIQFVPHEYATMFAV